MTNPDDLAPLAARQRIDKWMWHARVVKSRTMAKRLAVSGRVRLNRQRVSDASKLVRLGDVLTIALDRRVLVLKVVEFAERRGSAAIAAALFEDLSPKPLPAKARPIEPGPAGPAKRPTKKQRRQLVALRRTYPSDR